MADLRHSGNSPLVKLLLMSLHKAKAIGAMLSLKSLIGKSLRGVFVLFRDWTILQHSVGVTGERKKLCVEFGTMAAGSIELAGILDLRWEAVVEKWALKSSARLAWSEIKVFPTKIFIKFDLFLFGDIISLIRVQVCCKLERQEMNLFLK